MFAIGKTNTFCDSCEWTVTTVIKDLTNDSDTIIQFLVNHGIIKRFIICSRCGAYCFMKISGCKWFFACIKRVPGVGRKRGKRVPCGYSIAVKKQSFIGGSKLNPEIIVQLCSFWLLFPSPRYNFIKQELNLSSATITVWFNYCREICIDWVQKNSQQIGGKGIVVDINTSELEKIKFNKNQHNCSQWVLGGIERYNHQKIFLIPLDNQHQVTILKTVAEYILPGTTLISDIWREFEKANKEDFVFMKVNYSIQFISKTSNDHIQEVLGKTEGNGDPIPLDTFNGPGKYEIYSILSFGKKKKHFAGYLSEFIFKKYFQRQELLHEFFKHAASMYPPR